MNLVALVNALEQSGLDTATAETVASMAQARDPDEAQQVLASMVADSSTYMPYIEARRQAALRKTLPVKKDATHGGLMKDGMVQNNVVTRNGITVKTSKAKKSKAASPAVAGSAEEKIDMVRDLESALAALSVSRPDRERCDCLGAKHGLLEMAPNCLSCGRIVCNKEGMGPCLFCGNPLLPDAQVAQILAVLETQKADVVQTMSRKALAAAGLAPNAKNGAESTASATGSGNSGRRKGKTATANIPDLSGDVASLQSAEAQRDRLLDFQAHDAVRTRIIDHSGDLDLPDAGVSAWATVEEQAEQLRRQQQQLRRLEHERKQQSGLGRKVLSIDVRGNKIFTRVEDAAFEEDDSDAELVAHGEGEPVTYDEDDKTVHFFDPAAFRPGKDKEAEAVKGQAEKEAVGHEAVLNKVIRDEEEEVY